VTVALSPPHVSFLADEHRSSILSLQFNLQDDKARAFPNCPQCAWDLAYSAIRLLLLNVKIAFHGAKRVSWDRRVHNAANAQVLYCPLCGVPAEPSELALPGGIGIGAGGMAEPLKCREVTRAEGAFRASGAYDTSWPGSTAQQLLSGENKALRH
jgi:hypothetical protein